MIRINLLEVRPKSTERLDALLSPGGSSTFISRREGLLGILFLVLTVVILGVLAYRFTSDETEEAEPVATATEPPAAVPEPEPTRVPPRAEPEPASEPAATEPEPPAPQPEPALEPATPPTTPPARPPAPTPVTQSAPPAGGQSRAITAVRITPLADRVDVFLEMPNAPQVSSFKLDKPPRLVFDIPGALLQAPDSAWNQMVDSPLVSRLRIAQNTVDPPLVRLVLEAPAFPATQVSTSAAGLSIRVTPAP